ncbi:MAG TPA: oxidative damage protection protein [Coxiellaceae bacterium]|nr:oxidative damage protection protein [Coxiellaceae bacterium]
MSRIIFCQKLQQEAPGLDYSPYPGELGQRIFEHISQQAWQAWTNHQTMLINEYRLNLIEPKSHEYLEKEMEKFLFGEGSEKPAGYVEIDKK